MKIAIIHYNEIALKGKNRPEFENILIENILEKLEGLIKRIYKQESRILIEYCENEEKIIENLKKIFGISYFGIGKKLKRDKNGIIEYLNENIELIKDKTIKVETKRSDKKYPENSMEINKEIGEHLYEKLKLKIDLKNPQIKINIEVLENCFLVFLRRESGLEGLPIGSSGRLLCLLSGGIDSVVASYLMMGRGCNIDFLHIYSLSKERVAESKIIKLIKKLGEYGNRGRLYLIPYSVFYKYVFETNPKYELVLFRRFLYRIGEKICEKEDILGMVSGDSIGQVASQTIENIYSATYGIKIPIYRPLVGFNKLKTIKIAKEIGTYELSNEEYRDCCSLSSIKHPATKAKKERIDGFANEVNLDRIINEAIEKMEII
ncbi:MAG: tRNA uracil 4-sulfurtransferase ThiI [Candidatus Micrarchaeia archaeon]